MKKHQDEEEWYPASDDLSSKQSKIVLHNDNVHSFQDVIDALIEICLHDDIQAEQCAFVAHFAGVCEVKVGFRDEMIRMKSLLAERGLEVELT